MAVLVLLLALTGCAQPSDQPAPIVNMGQQNSSAGTAIVQKYDTLFDIANRFDLPMRDIITLNKVQPPFVIHENQRLRLPPPREYRVRSGDTLYEISRMFQTDMRSVAKLNRMRSPYTLQVGQKLRMPSPNQMVFASTDMSGVISPSSKPSASSNGKGTKKSQTAFSITPDGKPSTNHRNVNKALNVPARSGNGRFLLPVQGNVISSYGPKTGGLHNDGVNIAVPHGTTVKAAENGVVAYTGGDIEGYGNLVLIRHADGYMTAYAHLSDIAVKRGDKIKRGQSIAKVGATGNVDRPQLHFEIRKGSKALNPQPLI